MTEIVNTRNCWLAAFFALLGAITQATAATTSASAAVEAAAPLKLPLGKSNFGFVDRAGDPSRPVKVWMHVPAACDVNCPVQFVMHGVKRNGEDYLDHWVADANEYRFIVVAPEFGRTHFPKDDDYSLGRSTTEPDPAKWAFAIPEHLFDELKTRYGLAATSYRLFGHSAGGQFVHRLHLFNPRHRANPIIAANPGWYTLPEWGLLAEDPSRSLKFPHTTVDSRIDETRAKQALSSRFVLMLGDKDVDPDDPSLNRSKSSDAQGTFRYARGNHFFGVAERAAKKLGVPFRWEKVVVPGVAHEGNKMGRAALQYMTSNTDTPKDGK